MVGAACGGTGKTTSSGILHTRLLGLGLTASYYDAEPGLGDFAQLEPRAKLADLRELPGQQLVVDNIGKTQISVADTPAGGLREAVLLFKKVGLLDEARDGKFNLVIMHVARPEARSLGEGKEIRDIIGDAGQYFIVKNHVGDLQFDSWEQDGPFAAELRMLNSVSIDIPHLPGHAMEALRKRGGPFLDFVNDQNQSRLLRGYVNGWLQDSFKEFDRVGLLKWVAPSAG